MKKFMKLLDKDKKEFFDKMMDLHQYKKETPIIKENLKNLLRSIALKKIKEGLVPASKFLRLVYLCRITLMHNDISEKKFNKELIKRWKFIVHMQRLAKKKMESMYKAFHVQYLSAANDIFGDEENNAGVISEFSTLSEQLGMFKNESFESVENMKKHFVKSSINVRKYEFGPVEFNPEEHNDNFLENPEEFASKTNKTIKSSANYEILEPDNMDESFIQGREDPVKK